MECRFQSELNVCDTGMLLQKASQINSQQEVLRLRLKCEIISFYYIYASWLRAFVNLPLSVVFAEETSVLLSIFDQGLEVATFCTHNK